MQEEMNLNENAKAHENVGVEENIDATIQYEFLGYADVQKYGSLVADGYEDIDDIIQDEAIEYIDVQEQESYEIVIEESTGWTNRTEDVTHYDLSDRNQPDQHIIESITGLSDVLSDIQSLKSTLYASGGGL